MICTCAAAMRGRMAVVLSGYSPSACSAACTPASASMRWKNAASLSMPDRSMCLPRAQRITTYRYGSALEGAVMATYGLSAYSLSHWPYRLRHRGAAGVSSQDCDVLQSGQWLCSRRDSEQVRINLEH